MDWIETPDSSNIARFGYDVSSMVLYVEFKKGGSYQYFDVPESVFDAMRVAGSTGQFFGQNVKGVYRFART
ncbi:MAG: KTSC domain-containing protein [Pseudomonadota bacterium]|nr:KTSC domain-containing protein [Pseudomonadota bacterium]